jgi:hypothetical protein
MRAATGLRGFTPAKIFVTLTPRSRMGPRGPSASSEPRKIIRITDTDAIGRGVIVF